MNEQKRYTKKYDGTRTRCRVELCYPTPLSVKEEWVCGEAIDRFSELEDKLESGKLLELLADVGDTIYLPWVYDGNSGVARLPIIEITKDIRNNDEIYYHTDFETDCTEFAESQNYGICLHSNFGKEWFTDEIQAKSRLKELIKEASE